MQFNLTDLRQLSRIGAAKSKRIAEKYDYNLYKLFRADVADIVAIGNISKRTAEKVIEWASGEIEKMAGLNLPDEEVKSEVLDIPQETFIEEELPKMVAIQVDKFSVKRRSL